MANEPKALGDDAGMMERRTPDQIALARHILDAARELRCSAEALGFAALVRSLDNAIVEASRVMSDTPAP